MPIKYEAFLKMVKAMRKCQRDYFRAMDQAKLREACNWEAHVDAAIAEFEESLLPSQPSLFPEPKPKGPYANG